MKCCCDFAPESKSCKAQQHESYQEAGDDKPFGLLSNCLEGVSQEGKGHWLARFPSSQLLQLKLAVLGCCCNSTKTDAFNLHKKDFYLMPQVL